jgi:predicted nucleotidyltransferase
LSETVAMALPVIARHSSKPLALSVTPARTARVARSVRVGYHQAERIIASMSSFMEISPLLQPHLEAIRAICREYGVARLEVFGSVQTDKFDPATSDIDFLVEYPEGYDFGPWAKRLFELEETLSQLFDRSVDVVMTSALKREGFRLEAAKTRAVVYDDASLSRVA